MGKGSQDLALVCWGGGRAPAQAGGRAPQSKKGQLWGSGTYIALGGYSLLAEGSVASRRGG